MATASSRPLLTTALPVRGLRETGAAAREPAVAKVGA